MVGNRVSGEGQRTGAARAGGGRLAQAARGADEARADADPADNGCRQGGPSGRTGLANGGEARGEAVSPGVLQVRPEQADSAADRGDQGAAARRGGAES